MPDLSSLNALYREYQNGDLGKRDLEGKIFKVILDNLKDFYLFDGDEEEGIDYLCWLYPRLSRAIQNYRDNGAPFAAYISALVRYSIKEYQSRQTDHHITEYAAWTAQAIDFEVRSQDSEYPEEEEEEKPVRLQRLPPLKSRQLLLLILRSYFFLSEDFIERAAPFTGVEKEKLQEMIKKLRDRRSQKEENIRLFRERITTQFYRCLTWEKRLKYLLPESARYKKIQDQLERARKRLEKMRRRFTGIKLDATHKQIAEVTGISAGTVSSGLSRIKSYWKINQNGRPVKKDNVEEQEEKIKRR
jgi:DNA-directed RNA polymerase specialized sigma24 family protein